MLSKNIPIKGIDIESTQSYAILIKRLSYKENNMPRW